MDRIRQVFVWILCISVIWTSGNGEMVIEARESDRYSYKTDVDMVLRYTNNLETALKECYYKGGGQITVLKDSILETCEGNLYEQITSNTQLVIPQDIYVNIGNRGLINNGTIHVYGTLDIVSEEGYLLGDGKIYTHEQGKVMRYQPDSCWKEGSVFQTTPIYYGQKLSEADIIENSVSWSMSQRGNWQWERPYVSPAVGTYYEDVSYQPTNHINFEKFLVQGGARVTVLPAIPKLKEYMKQTLLCGERLYSLKDTMTFVNPYTGEKVEGRVSVDEPLRQVETIGEAKVLIHFYPNDVNYKATEQEIDVWIKKALPKIRQLPVIDTEPVYGEKLQDIPLKGGECIHPTTGEKIEGTWKWKNEKQTAELGEREYRIVFVPDKEGYEVKETTILLNTVPKKMTQLILPTGSSLTYGETVGMSQLSFTETEYGFYEWVNEKEVPCVSGGSAQILFTPKDTLHYDWSQLEGYQEKTKQIIREIPLDVRPRKGKIGKITVGVGLLGESLSTVSLSLDKEIGHVEWDNPNQLLEANGTYKFIFTPKDKENYDWSEYNPDKEGRIYLTTAIRMVSQKIVEESKQEIQEPEDSIVITTLVSKMTPYRTKLNIAPRQGKIIRIRRKGKKVTVICHKQKGCFYQVRCCSKKNSSTFQKKNSKKNTVTIKKLKKGKKYYFRVRNYKKSGTKKIFGKWSPVKVA